MTLSRRSFLAGVPAALALGRLPAAESGPRLKIAAVVTVYRKGSHAEHIVDRFLEGYGWNNQFYRPEVDVVSLYVDQTPENDLSRERAARHPEMKIYPTIAEALTRGGDRLAVDAVILDGEHGNYKRNERGQTLYPRYEFFKQIVEVYKKSGKTAPVFNDKHLSWSWDWAKEMYDTARQMGFGLMAGSLIPVTWRTPALDLPLGAEVEEAMCVCGGSVDSYDFHGLEAIQCMLERRKGGETGVVALHAIRGENVWKALQAGSWAAGGWDPVLFEACLSRSHTLTPARRGFNDILPRNEYLPRLVKAPFAYRYEYADGTKATMLSLRGLVQDFNFAARLKGKSEPLSTQMYYPVLTVANCFNPQCHHMETFFRTGKSPYPVERTLLTTALTAAGVESLFQGEKRLETPHLAIRYQPTKESTYWRS
jgi:hypothetical protein